MPAAFKVAALMRISFLKDVAEVLRTAEADVPFVAVVVLQGDAFTT